MSSARDAHIAKNSEFYANNYNKFLFIFVVAMLLALALVFVVMYQVFHRPVPVYKAFASRSFSRTLSPEMEPNLLPSTLIKWASKAAVTAYTFDFVNYENELMAARSYFTDAGWEAYKNSIAEAIQTVKQNQLFVSSVIVGAPVIAHQGELPGRGYVWRIQLPFLVTYQSAESTTRQFYTVILTIVRVPTWENPTAIGIDQFVMSSESWQR